MFLHTFVLDFYKINFNSLYLAHVNSNIYLYITFSLLIIFHLKRNIAKLTLGEHVPLEHPEVVGAGGGVAAPSADDVPAQQAHAVDGAGCGAGRGAANTEAALYGQVALLATAPLQQLLARQPLGEVHLAVLQVLVGDLGR